MNVSNLGLRLIRKFEGCRLKAYRCPAGVLTIGYGHTGLDVVEGLAISDSKADALLSADLAVFEKGVLSAVGKTVLTQGQFDALVSFAFNLGLEALRRSTLLKLLKKGEIQAAANEFLLWTKAAGRVLPGLVTRRNDERTRFLN